jgi:hypothetical protein
MILASRASQRVGSAILSVLTRRDGSARAPGSPHAAPLMYFRTREVCAPEQKHFERSASSQNTTLIHSRTRTHQPHKT